MSDTTVAPQWARDELYKIIREESSFEQKAREALDLGVQYFEVEHGYVSWIDHETNMWKSIASTDGSDGRFPEGLELNLETTYCRRTTEDGKITLHDAPNQGWEDDPAFETHGLHCYHGTPIFVGGEQYGAVCFMAEDPREEFSEGESMFAELIAKLLERELEREQVEADLTRQTNLAIVLNRILRHNLRNDMSVIRGFTQMMAEKLDDPQQGETALNTIDKLIELAEKARKLDRIVGAESKRTRTEVTELIEDIVQTVSRKYPNASLSVEYNEKVTASVSPNFEQALTELIDNAAKHSGETPTVTVSVESTSNTAEIQIVDDGPGLADHEANVLQTGTETPLKHGSGLGLWLSHWIVTGYGGSVDATITDHGTTMTVSVPRNPTSVSEQQLTDGEQQLAELQRARDQYRAAFDEANDAIIMLNDDAQIIDANPEASNIFGLKQKALLGQPLQRFLPHEFGSEATWNEFNDDKQDRGTATIVGANGIERLIEYSTTADVIPGQHLIVIRDVTERKEREQKLEFTQDLLTKTERIADVGGWEIDTETNEVFWTDHLFEMLGVEYDEEPSLDEALDVYIEEDRPRIEAAVEEALSAGEGFDTEVRFRHSDGEIRWLNIRGEPTMEDGEVMTLRGAAQDITEWKRRERVLREMHNIISNRQRSFEDKVQALLELGRAELDAKYGTVSRICGEEYVFEFVDADDDSIQPGDVVPVSATNCEIVANTEQTLVLGDIERDAPEETDRAGFTEWGISCYIGAPTFVESEVYGTFCFYDTEPRADQFSDWEVTLVDLMSDWVSHEIQQQNEKEEDQL